MTTLARPTACSCGLHLFTCTRLLITESANALRAWVCSLCVLFLFGGAAVLQAQTPGQQAFWEPDPLADAWVDSVYAGMTEDERLGQLFMVRAHSNLGPEHQREVEKLIREEHVGGLLFFQGSPERQALLTNHYQELSGKVPLMIAMDAEWGLGMRLKENAISFPKQLTLGSIEERDLIYEMGAEIGRELRRLGVHINFAPVADINNNPENPVINVRSFGEDRYEVTTRSYLYARGMQDQKVLACAKHFPGHGDTDVDSHLDLPLIPHDRQRLDSVEMYPFQELCQRQLGSVMIAHLQVPALDSTPHLPTTLSPRAVYDILRKQWKYKGLIITDGLGMKGVTKYFPSGELEAMALLAGNDLLLLPEDVPAAKAAIRRYLAEGKLSPERIEESVRRILRLKYWLGLQHYKPIDLGRLRSDLNNPRAQALKRQLYQHALCWVNDRDNALPFRKIDGIKTASLSIGASVRTPFQQRIHSYIDTDDFLLPADISSSRAKRYLRMLKPYRRVIVGLHGLNPYAAKGFGLKPSAVDFLKKLLAQNKQVVLVVFGTPYVLASFEDFPYLLLAHEGAPFAQDVAAQALFGAFRVSGKLPVSVGNRLRAGQGIERPSLWRLSYGLPEEEGMDSQVLLRIDTLAMHAIDSGATPGCVVLIARNGRVVFHKAYGYHTYARRQPMAPDDIFDLASVTKVAATTLSVMKLYETGKLRLSDTLACYLPETDTTDKACLVVEDVLRHRAGLQPWIPFYEETVSERKRQPLSNYYRRRSKPPFDIQVTNNLYLLDSYRDSIWYKILQSPLQAQPGYKYSDLGLYLMAETIHRLTGMPLDQYADKTFYRPLGLRTTGFNPRQRFPLSRIPPTEEDDYFRHQRIQGYVHDMGAAMLGGVSGHAGLFSDAEDLAVIFQMLLNGGYYGGRRYLKAETIARFTQRCENCSRRGIGFDMKQLDPTQTLNVSALASERAFGHLGFTGISAWADPAEGLVFIFLSNRTYPKMTNRKLAQMNFRPRIQTVAYEAIR